MKTLSCITLSLVLGACLGCGRSTSFTGPDGEKTTVTRKGKSAEVTIKGKDGQEAQIGEGVPLPADFPKDVAIYPKATVFTSMQDKKGTTSVVLKTAEPAQQIGTFYQEKLKEAAWEIENTVNMPNGMMLQAAKEGRKLMVMISGNPGQTIISLTLEKNE